MSSVNNHLKALFESNEYVGHRKVIISSAGTSKRNNLKDYLGPNDLLYAEVLPNPSLNQLIDFFSIIQPTLKDVVFGIGGGSVIDFSKLIALFSQTQSADIKGLIESGRFQSIEKALKLVIVPTLFGSGAEQTPFAVCHIGKKKYSVANTVILPSRVEYVPELNISAPTNVKLANVLDCFCQAAESLTAQKANEDSLNFAENTLKILIPIAKDYVRINDLSLANKMAEASMQCGRAIAISKTTGPHAMSYYLTNQLGLSHGNAVGIMFLYFFEKYEEKLFQDEAMSALKNVMNKYFDNNRRELYPSICSYFEALGFDWIELKNTISQCINYKIWCESVNKERLLNGPNKTERFVKEELLLNYFNNLE